MASTDALSRPVGVWVILAYHSLGLLFMLLLQLVYATRTLVLPPAYVRLLGGRPFSPSFLFAAALLLIWLVQLYRLKRSAPFIFTALIAFRAMHFIGSSAGSAHWSNPAGQIVGYGLNILICAYAWQLWRLRVLR